MTDATSIALVTIPRSSWLSWVLRDIIWSGPGPELHILRSYIATAYLLANCCKPLICTFRDSVPDVVDSGIPLPETKEVHPYTPV